MKICFMGTSFFAYEPLKKILENNFNITCVFTKEPKPIGRKQIITKGIIYSLAEEHNIPIRTPKRLKNNIAEIEYIKKENFDIIIVASYGLILPKEILDAPRLGCINIHASLLPMLRGASPIAMCIKLGLTKTGISIMQMDEGIDTGNIFFQKELQLNDNITTPILTNELGKLGSYAILEFLKNPDKFKSYKQSEGNASYAPILKKEDGLINFKKETAVEIERKIRAYNPFPSVFFRIDKSNTIKIISAKVIQDKFNIEAGKVIIENNALFIKCKEGLLQIIELQKSGKKITSASSFLQGNILPNIIN